MKRFAIVGLSMLCLSLATTTSVKAGTRTEIIAMHTATISVDIVSPKITPLASPRRSGTRTGLTAMSTATIGNDTANTKLTPFALAALAYQGEYRSQGIPSFGSFLTAASNKTVTAKDLVAAAIAANQLTPDTQTDIGYLNAVDLQLSVNRN